MNDERLPPIRMPKKLKDELECLAKADGRTLSDYVRRVLEQHARSVECFEELVDIKESGEIDKTPRPIVAWRDDD